MKNSFLRQFACFGVMFIIGILANHKVLAEPVWVWMELESKIPISTRDELTECFIISAEDRAKAEVGRSVFKTKNVRFKGESFYLREDVELPLKDVYRPLVISSEDDELEFEGDIGEDDYSPIKYYLTKLAYECDRDKAQDLINPRREYPFEGTMMKPVIVRIGRKSIKAYLSFGNRAITSVGEIIPAQDVRPFEPIPSFDAKHKGNNVWEFRLVPGSDVLKPIPQAPLNVIWAERPFRYF